MNFLGKIKNSILLKFTCSILGILVVSFVFFLWYIRNSNYQMLRSVYEARKHHIEIQTEKNLKNAVRDCIQLINLRIKQHKKALANALFTVNERGCKELIRDLATFPSIKGALLYDSLVDKPFLSAVKNQAGEFVFVDKASSLDGLSSLKVKLTDGETGKQIGYLEIFYDPAFFTKDVDKMNKEALTALEDEFDLAQRTLHDNFKKQIFVVIFIFVVLYVAIYLLFSKIINEPIQKLEKNLKSFFNFLSDKNDEIKLCEIRTDDEFGRMGRFINSGIEVSIKIHLELERHTKELSRLATVMEQSAQAIVITDTDGNIEYVNKAFEKTTGYSFDEVKGKNPRILKSGQHTPEFYKKLWDTITSGQSWEDIFTNKKKDGTLYYERSTIFPVKNRDGEIINYAAVKQDITKERILEQQLRQAQKMESIGTLAGGIAHDFNNLLTVINGFVELSLMKIGPDDPAHKNIASVLEASKRAQTLTSQLLAFSRKQVYDPEILDLNDVIYSMEKMMRRLIGEDIHIMTCLGENLPKIKADTSQLEQIFVNLIVNARDALNAVEKPDFHKMITIETGRAFLDSDYCSQHPGSRPGEYVYFAVSDNGIGMDEDTKQKIFEPFFTTKEKHKGTGLGLSMIYGIVKQNKGCIYVYSELDKGTMFKIYWPVSKKQQPILADKPISDELFRGNETILIVEDEEEVRRLALEALRSLGYTVYEATNGRQALDLLESGLKVDLVITDLIMPEMNGKELAEKAKKIFPNGKIIYVSGYSDDHIAHNGLLEKGVNFIPKPYSIKQLSSMIRRVLDEK